jgi:hypothetical protein
LWSETDVDASLDRARLIGVDIGQTARARVLRHVWSVLPDGLPASKVADTELGEVVVLDVDAMIVVSHSEKQNAAPTFKGTFGFHPLGAWCDNTTELLAAVLRPGNAGANTAAELIEVLLAPRYGHWWSGRARRPRRPSETTDRLEWT